MTDGEIAVWLTSCSTSVRKLSKSVWNFVTDLSGTAAYGHMGREPQVVSKTFFSRYEGNKTVEVELFTWEKLDYVDKIKAAFGL